MRCCIRNDACTGCDRTSVLPPGRQAYSINVRSLGMGEDRTKGSLSSRATSDVRLSDEINSSSRGLGGGGMKRAFPFRNLRNQSARTELKEPPNSLALVAVVTHAQCQYQRAQYHVEEKIESVAQQD